MITGRAIESVKPGETVRRELVHVKLSDRVYLVAVGKAACVGGQKCPHKNKSAVSHDLEKS